MLLEETQAGLVDACRRGDSDALRAIFDLYKDRLYSVALRYSGNSGAAEDIVQDTFLKLCRQSADEIHDRLAEWLFTVCRNRALDVLRKEGFAVEKLIYGRFTHHEYRRALLQTDLAVFVTPTETQSLAQAEAWATDIPTLVWRGGRMRVGDRTFTTSSAPYLSEATGRWFADSEELAALLERWPGIRAAVAPRQWVLENMTDAVCARRYMDLVDRSAPR